MEGFLDIPFINWSVVYPSVVLKDIGYEIVISIAISIPNFKIRYRINSAILLKRIRDD